MVPAFQAGFCEFDSRLLHRFGPIGVMAAAPGLEPAGRKAVGVQVPHRALVVLRVAQKE